MDVTHEGLRQLIDALESRRALSHPENCRRIVDLGTSRPHTHGAAARGSLEASAYSLDRDTNLLARLLDGMRKEREEIECALRRAANATAPVNMVPDEVLRLVFAFCDSNDLHRISYTCYRFHDIITQTVSYCSEIKISWKTNIPPIDTLYAQVRRIQHLPNVNLSFNIRVILDYVPTPEQVKKFQSALKDLNFLPRCTSISIKTHGDNVLEWLMPLFIPFTPQLKSLYLSSCTSASESIDLSSLQGRNLETLDINAPRLSVTFRKFESTKLQKLILNCCHIDPPLFRILNKNVNVSVLMAWIGGYWFEEEGPTEMIHLPHLQALSLKPANDLYLVRILDISSVTRLILDTFISRPYKAEHIQMIKDHPFVNLRHLRLSPRVDNSFTLEMLQAHPTIEYLSVYGCARTANLFKVDGGLPLTFPKAPVPSLRTIEIRYLDRSRLALSMITQCIADALVETYQVDDDPVPGSREHIRFVFEKADGWPENVDDLVAQFPRVVSVVE